tara:strand:+ start:86284 stop:86631 length:348 start_codon:yes stop_codon:yes gene_type:complete
MHDTDDNNELLFKCDFCKMPWADTRPMVEGHRGSLICGQCLSIAYTELIHLDSGYAPAKGEACVLCLETDRKDLHWQSPIDDASIACKRCIKQSAGVLKKDPDNGWTRPADPSKA